MNIPSHGKYKWLPLLYNFISELYPKKVVELGPATGHTTVTMGQALKDSVSKVGHINSYDIWDDQYWGTQENCQKEINEWGVQEFVTLKHLLYQWGYIIDHWIKSEVIFVHKHNIKRDWDKGKKTQRIEDGLFESLNPDYSYYDNYDKIITTGPQVLSDGVASNTSVETHIDLTSKKHYKLEYNKDNNDLE